MSLLSSAIYNLKNRVKALKASGASENEIIARISSEDFFKGFPLQLSSIIPIIFYLPADASFDTIFEYFLFVEDSHIIDTGVIDHRFVEADKRFAVVDNKLNLLNKKSDKLPIVSTIVQSHGNTIDAMIDEDKMLREKIRDLSDRLDFHDRLNKFVCSVFHPTTLEGQAKELYGLICPTDIHDEL
jgi:hypothetical protein